MSGHAPKLIAALFVASALGVALYLVSNEVSAYYKLPRETEDYVMSSGCGCGGASSSEQVTTIEKLQNFSAFGQHLLIWQGPNYQENPNQTILNIQVGDIHKVFVSWLAGDQIYHTELSPESITVVIDETIKDPTVQWKWNVESLSWGIWGKENLGGLATSATIRLSKNQYDLEPALKDIVPQTPPAKTVEKESL